MTVKLNHGYRPSISVQGYHGRSRLSAIVIIGLSCILPAPAWAQCTSDAHCNDNLFCTTDICITPGPSGFCLNVVRTCLDSVYCNGDEQCDETRDLCEFACLGGGTCSGGFCGGGSNPGTPCDAVLHSRSCPPGLLCNESLNACTECISNADCPTEPNRICRPGFGVCVDCLEDSQCVDGLYCNGTETCDEPSGSCVAGVDVQCTFGQFCGESVDRCVECEFDSHCDDGRSCNGTETCNGSYVCVAGTPVSCKRCAGGPDNGAPCAVDGTDCGSPGTCTGPASYCSAAFDRCVLCEQDLHCEDLNFCTNNYCYNGSCSFPHNDGKCANGIFCDGEERCVNQIGVCNVTTGVGCCFDGADPVLDDGIPCTVDTCSEAQDQVLHTPSDANCGDPLGCNGVETCDPANANADPFGCVAGTAVDCSNLNTDCRQGQGSEKKVCSNNASLICTANANCVARTGICSNKDQTCTSSAGCPTGGVCGGAGTCSVPLCQCTSYAVRNGEVCDDEDPCTAVSACSNQNCVEQLPLANDPYRCVRLEWRNTPSSPVTIGSTVTLDLYAVADNCNVTTSSDCPSPTQHPIVGLDAVLTWKKTALELKPTVAGDLNPLDPCNSPNSCTPPCPADQADWAGSGFFNDCALDRLNAPCTPGQTPANDGDALYTALSESECSTGVLAPPACVTPSGMYITRLKFKAIQGGTSSIDLAECKGDRSLTRVLSAAPRPTGYISSNVTKSIGLGATITVLCNNNSECNDSNECTNDACSCNAANCGGTCSNVPRSGTCNDGLFCTNTDACNIQNGSCVGSGDPCTSVKACNGGTRAGLTCTTNSDCTPAGQGWLCVNQFCDEAGDRCVRCRSAADCGDNNPCTQDVCNAQGDCEHPSIDCSDGLTCTADSCIVVPPNAQCVHQANDAACASGFFCQASRCNPAANPATNPSGCDFGNECVSANGNPCLTPGSCNESNDTCGGCLTPTAVASGSRYLKITPPNQGTTPIALMIRGDCNDSAVGCVEKYVQSTCKGGTNDGNSCTGDANCPKACDGGTRSGLGCTIDTECTPLGSGFKCVGSCSGNALGGTPMYRTAAAWGAFLQVTGMQILPGTNYLVVSQCNFAGGAIASAATEATTWKWGDATGEGSVNVFDISATVDIIKLTPTSGTYEGSNVWPCDIDRGNVNVLDLASFVDAVKGKPFPCAAICP